MEQPDALLELVMLANDPEEATELESHLTDFFICSYLLNIIVKTRICEHKHFVIFLVSQNRGHLVYMDLLIV